MATVRSLSKSIMSRVYSRAKKDGRICRRCGWIISKKNWAEGFLLCAGCWSALQGVNVSGGWNKPQEEFEYKTGEML